MPLLGCLDLLLGKVADASLHFSAIRDEELLRWLAEHPGDHLAAQCEYCRVWLERDVLPGYRDVDAAGVDLDAWFADRDVQAYVDRIDRQTARLGGSAATATETELSSVLSADASSLHEAALDDDHPPAEEAPSSDPTNQRLSNRLRWLAASVVVGLVAALAAAVMLRPRETAPVVLQPELDRQDAVEPRSSAQDSATLKPEAILQPEASAVAAQLQPLLTDAPDDAQLRRLVQGWLDSKAQALQGQPSQLPVVARQRLIDRVDQERGCCRRRGHHHGCQGLGDIP